MTTTDTRTPISARVRTMLADTLTPVTLYLKLRDHYTDPVLLESNDFRVKEDCHSFLGLQAIASFTVQDGRIIIRQPNMEPEHLLATGVEAVPDAFRAFAASFDVQYPEGPNREFNGFFGHVGFDAVRYFDTLHFDPAKRRTDIPDIRFTLYRFVIKINHFRDEMTILENLLPGQASELDTLETRIRAQRFTTHRFRREGEEASNLTDEEFRELVRVGKRHCQLGDVFQIVFSRRFSQRFTGDDFNVYRVLRSINPSPYLFYFDYGSYRIFGSSPETQMRIRQGVARVNPIAGTYRRSGDPDEDASRAHALTQDPKENAEHIMLVDLARNDLGRHATNVRVNKLKEIQYFSHVIHLTSQVEGDLPPDANPFVIFGDTFPAGTLSGAPKYKAIELINAYEKDNRSFYGGSLGFVDFNGDMNQAIVIRSFLSLDNTLHCQAGAGIVVASDEESELQEVNNKLGALKRALAEAERVS